MQEQDTCARMNALCVFGTGIQYKTSVFYTWRTATTYMKKCRINRLIKAWACLVKYRAHNRIDKNLVQLFLRRDALRRKVTL